MENPAITRFSGVAEGEWCIVQSQAICGDGLAQAPCLAMTGAATAPAADAVWSLTGVSSNIRYTTATERSRLTSAQAPLGRPEARLAALIPIRKNAAWWELAQDERRQIFEERSRHIRIGMDYLPAIARKLHHCRDTGGPFDFLTWFEFAPEAESDFNKMVDRLRVTEEWRYVEREVDIRLKQLNSRDATL
jgi:chlorite dismutase